MSVPLHRKLSTFLANFTYLADTENTGDVAAFELSIKKKKKKTEMLITIVLYFKDNYALKEFLPD